MSDEPVTHLPDPAKNGALSLEHRMAAAADGLAQATTENFPIPRWSSMCWVRLKVIPHKLQRQAVDTNVRVRPQATQDIYIAADTLLAATDGFLEVNENELTGEQELTEYPTSWAAMASVVYKMEEATPRQAIIRMIGAENIVIFYGQYVQWLTGERSRITEEQTRDFQPTP
jgi:hypothetical protein